MVALAAGYVPQVVALHLVLPPAWAEQPTARMPMGEPSSASFWYQTKAVG